jgi:ABC-2 type transport system ATP-binding protein
MDSPTVSTENLTRRFGEFVAVEDVNLRVARGQFFGFLGPNGAGKSTTIKMLTGLLAPTSGQIQILGLDLATNLVEVKRQIGVVPEGMALFGRLTGSECLNFVGRMYGLDRETAAKWLPTTRTGCRRSLALAAAVIREPKVLISSTQALAQEFVLDVAAKSTSLTFVVGGSFIIGTSVEVH